MDHIRWTRIEDESPPRDQVVMTKIDDADGCRNEGPLVLHNRGYWFLPDLSMYVYYNPTHWAPMPGQVEPRHDVVGCGG